MTASFNGEHTKLRQFWSNRHNVSVNSDLCTLLLVHNHATAPLSDTRDIVALAVNTLLAHSYWFEPVISCIGFVRR